MKSSTIAVLICLIFSTGSSSAQSPLPKLDPDTASVVMESNTFALDLYGKLAQQDGNLFFSPYSISTALAMTYAGARGETASQMAKTLHFMLGQERLHSAFGHLTKELQGTREVRQVPPKYQLHIASHLWGQKDYQFLPDFLKTIQNNYDGGFKEVDFINARDNARRTINAWVEEKTRDKIKELVQPGILTEDTRLVLTNAIYFKASWSQPFWTGQTKEDDFIVADGKKVKAQMMNQSISTGYYQGDDFEVLELHYEMDDLSMIVLLPSKASSLSSLEKRLTAPNLTQWLRKRTDHQVVVTMPKFKVATQYMLKDVLSEMGMPLLFDSNQADLSGMTTREQLFIKHAIHKAFVDVSETGTEAGVSTFMTADSAMASRQVTFRADHPFVYLIRDNRTGSILFLGRVVDTTGVSNHSEDGLLLGRMSTATAGALGVLCLILVFLIILLKKGKTSKIRSA